MPRERMMSHLNSVHHIKKSESEEGKLIVAALRKAVTTSEIKSGARSPEGAYNVVQAYKFCLENDPSTAAALALALKPRIDLIGTRDLMTIVASPNSKPDEERLGLYTILEKLNPKQREELTGILYDTYRLELVKRHHSAKDIDDDQSVRPALVNTILDLKKLRNPAAGWKPLGKVPPSERVWRFKSFDPMVEKDQLPIKGKEWHRIRDIQLPDDLQDWFKPEYDDTQWSAGKAPSVSVSTNRAKLPLPTNPNGAKGNSWSCARPSRWMPWTTIPTA